MAKAKLRHVAINCEDLEGEAQFFKDAFDLEEVGRAGDVTKSGAIYMSDGVMNIALLIFRSHWNYLFGLVMVALYFFIFWEQRLFAESALQVFFFAAQGWGWWLWLRVGGDDHKVAVRWLDWRSRIVWLTVTAALSPAPEPVNPSVL